MLPCNPIPDASLVAGPDTAPVELVARLNRVAVSTPANNFAIVPPTVLGRRATVYNEGGSPLTIVAPEGVEFLVQGSSASQVVLAPGYAFELVCLDDQWLVFVSA